MPALDLRKLSRTQQVKEQMEREVLAAGGNSVSRSMFERNSFYDFTSSQRGDLQSQRDLVRVMKEDM